MSWESRRPCVVRAVPQGAPLPGQKSEKPREIKSGKKKNHPVGAQLTDLLIPMVSSSDFEKYLLEIWKEFKVWRTSARGVPLKRL